MLYVLIAKPIPKGFSNRNMDFGKEEPLCVLFTSAYLKKMFDLGI